MLETPFLTHFLYKLLTIVLSVIPRTLRAGLTPLQAIINAADLENSVRTVLHRTRLRSAPQLHFPADMLEESELVSLRVASAIHPSRTLLHSAMPITLWIAVARPVDAAVFVMGLDSAGAGRRSQEVGGRTGRQMRDLSGHRREGTPLLLAEPD